MSIENDYLGTTVGVAMAETRNDEYIVNVMVSDKLTLAGPSRAGTQRKWPGIRALNPQIPEHDCASHDPSRHSISCIVV